MLQLPRYAGLRGEEDCLHVEAATVRHGHKATGTGLTHIGMVDTLLNRRLNTSLSITRIGGWTVLTNTYKRVHIGHTTHIGGCTLLTQHI